VDQATAYAAAAASSAAMDISGDAPNGDSSNGDANQMASEPEQVAAAAFNHGRFSISSSHDNGMDTGFGDAHVGMDPSSWGGGSHTGLSNDGIYSGFGLSNDTMDTGGGSHTGLSNDGMESGFGDMQFSTEPSGSGGGSSPGLSNGNSNSLDSGYDNNFGGGMQLSDTDASDWAWS
jgi:hypothetical protein